MNKSESKYFNTARMMDQALIELLSKKGFEFITVKEICETAGVNRSTFYLHYETIADLLEETIEYVEAQYGDAFKDIPFGSVSDIDKMPLKDLLLINKTYLIPYLRFVYDNRILYRAYTNNQVSLKTGKRLGWLKKNIFEPILERFGVPEEDRNYWLVFTVSGIWAIIQVWINEGCEDSIDHVATMIEYCIRSDIHISYEND